MALVLGVVLFLSVPILRGWVSRLVIQSVYPVVVAGRWVGEQAHLSPSNKRITQERDALRRQVSDLTNRVYESSVQLETVSSLEALKAFSQSTHRNIVTAAVIAASPDPGVQSIIINRGSDDGLRHGLLVVSEQGSVIGKLVTVRQAFSTVLLIPDRQSVIAARVQNAAQSPGIIRGERGLALQMGFIPKNDEVKNGQTVVTTGTEPDVPPDILIGTITSTSLRTGDLFQQAIVTPAAAFLRLHVVAVIVA